MARPIKSGLDYFPFDTDFSDNEKVGAIMGEFGSKGVLMMVYLLSAVYKKGYYLQWNKLTEMQLVNKIDGMSSELANQIVTRLIAYGTFNEELFNSAKVLTSQRIQETYLDATKRRKSQKPLLYGVNVNINHHSNDVNDNISTQSKVNESKENKSNDSSPKSKHRTYEPDDKNYQLASYMLETIRSVNPNVYPVDAKNQPNLQSWANDIRLTHERDARTYEQIKELIDWSQNDSFWRKNILSPAKLRKQFGNLISKAEDTGSNSYNINDYGRDPQYDLPY